jgi:hypothetical protein
MSLRSYFLETKKAGGGRWALLFLLRFLAASILLYLLYLWGGKYYALIIAHGCRPVLALFNRPVIIGKALSVTEEVSLNPVVFLSLVIALMNIPAARKIRAGIIGVLILTAANIATVSMAFMSYYQGSEALWTGTEFFNLTINFFLPIFLWLALLPVIQALPLRREG